MIAPGDALKLTNNGGQTLAARIATRRPARIALSFTGGCIEWRRACSPDDMLIASP